MSLIRTNALVAFAFEVFDNSVSFKLKVSHSKSSCDNCELSAFFSAKSLVDRLCDYSSCRNVALADIAESVAFARSIAADDSYLAAACYEVIDVVLASRNEYGNYDAVIAL